MRNGKIYRFQKDYKKEILVRFLPVFLISHGYAVTAILFCMLATGKHSY